MPFKIVFYAYSPSFTRTSTLTLAACFYEFYMVKFCVWQQLQRPVKVFPNTKPINIKLTATHNVLTYQTPFLFHMHEKTRQCVSSILFSFLLFLSFLVSISFKFVLLFLSFFLLFLLPSSSSLSLSSSSSKQNYQKSSTQKAIRASFIKNMSKFIRSLGNSATIISDAIATIRQIICPSLRSVSLQLLTPK